MRNDTPPLPRELADLARIGIEERTEARAPRTLRVIFDARPGRSCLTGIGRYSRTMAGLLREGVAGHALGLLGEGGLQLHASSVLEEELELPALLARERAEVYHTPLFHLPGVVPCRTVVTIHDAIPLVKPHLATDNAKRLFEGVSDGALRADVVVCPSHSAKADVARTVGVDPARIQVVPETPDPLFHKRLAPDEVAFRLARLRLASEGPFALVVGSLDRRKDPFTVLDALRILGDRGPRAVFAGPPGDVDVLAEARARGVEERVRVLGPVPDSTLHALYAGASALVHASLYEGFGLPIVEAFAAGTPVISSSAASLHEIVGEAGLTFVPGDAAGLAERLLRLADDPSLEVELRRLARDRLDREFAPDIVRARLAEVWTAAAQAEPARARRAQFRAG